MGKGRKKAVLFVNKKNQKNFITLGGGWRQLVGITSDPGGKCLAAVPAVRGLL
jgi:hypothetical protein